MPHSLALSQFIYPYSQHIPQYITIFLAEKKNTIETRKKYLGKQEPTKSRN